MWKYLFISYLVLLAMSYSSSYVVHPPGSLHVHVAHKNLRFVISKTLQLENKQAELQEENLQVLSNVKKYYITHSFHLLHIVTGTTSPTSTSSRRLSSPFPFSSCFLFHHSPPPSTCFCYLPPPLSSRLSCRHPKPFMKPFAEWVRSMLLYNDEGHMRLKHSYPKLNHVKHVIENYEQILNYEIQNLISEAKKLTPGQHFDFMKDVRYRPFIPLWLTIHHQQADFPFV